MFKKRINQYFGFKLDTVLGRTMSQETEVEKHLEPLVRRKIIITEKLIEKKNTPALSNIDDRIKEEIEILKLEKELNKIIKQINDFLIPE